MATTLIKWCVCLTYNRLEVRKMLPRSDEVLAQFDTKAEADRLYKRLKPIQDAFRAEQAASDEAHRQRCQDAAAVRDAAIAEILNAKS